MALPAAVVKTLRCKGRLQDVNATVRTTIRHRQRKFEAQLLCCAIYSSRSMCGLSTQVVLPKIVWSRQQHMLCSHNNSPAQFRLTWHTCVCGFRRLFYCPSDNGDGFNAQDNPNVRELVDRMQRYHDEVEKEFTGQKVRDLVHVLGLGDRKAILHRGTTYTTGKLCRGRRLEGISCTETLEYDCQLLG